MRVLVTGAAASSARGSFASCSAKGLRGARLARSDPRGRLDDIGSEHALARDLRPARYREIGSGSPRSGPTSASIAPGTRSRGSTCTRPRTTTACRDRARSRPRPRRCRLYAPSGVGTCFEYDTALGILAEDSPTRPATVYAQNKAGVIGSARRVLRRGRAGVRVGAPLLSVRALRGREATRALRRPRAPRGPPGAHHCRRAGAGLPPFRRRRGGVVGDRPAPRCRRSTSGRVGPSPCVTWCSRSEALLGRPGLDRAGALPYQPGDPPVVQADNRRLVEECAWAPGMTLEQGLRETVDWWARSSAMSGTPLVTIGIPTYNRAAHARARGPNPRWRRTGARSRS